jgi:hypothetical protein
MTCNRTLVIAIAICGGCVQDVPTLYETATAQMNATLDPPDDHIPTDLGHYRWELVEAPPVEGVGDLWATTASITITPPSRGIYAFNRWFVGQADEQLSYHVILTVEGAAPTAVIVGPTSIPVGTATALDGSFSASPESLHLEFQWRLAIRPASSTADLADVSSPTLNLVPDVAGQYAVELRVFDGELWSQPAKTTLIAR